MKLWKRYLLYVPLFSFSAVFTLCSSQERYPWYINALGVGLAIIIGWAYAAADHWIEQHHARRRQREADQRREGEAAIQRYEQDMLVLMIGVGYNFNPKAVEDLYAKQPELTDLTLDSLPRVRQIAEQLA